jgi:hypothetical protein
MNDRSQMTLARLGELLDTYGADPGRWPPEERDAALALLAHSAEAQRQREASAQLDAVLNLAPAHAAPPALVERILAAAPQRGLCPQPKVESPTSKVAGQDLRAARRSSEIVARGERAESATGADFNVAASPPALGFASPPTGRRASRRFRVWRYVGAALPLAAAAALVLWLLRAPAPTPERTRVTMAELGTYDVPTDALLTTPSLETLDSVPSFGCTGSGLGCLDSEPLNKQSALDWEACV